MTSEPVLRAVADELTAALGPALLGLAVHGSWVMGDFDSARSDLDLLAVLDRPPDDDVLAALPPAVARLEERFPHWRGRFEVELVGRDAVAAHVEHVVRGLEPPPHLIARVSPGEVLHLLPATSHRVLTWASVHDHGRSLVGPSPDLLLPDVPAAVVRGAVLDHVRDWPAWARAMHGAGGQAYAVLTVCRAHALLTTDAQLSKRAAGAHAETALPAWADLVRWAGTWWYAGGHDDEPPRPGEVTAFVDAVCADLLA